MPDANVEAPTPIAEPYIETLWSGTACNHPARSWLVFHTLFTSHDFRQPCDALRHGRPI